MNTGGKMPFGETRNNNNKKKLFPCFYFHTFVVYNKRVHVMFMCYIPISLFHTTTAPFIRDNKKPRNPGFINHLYFSAIKIKAIMIMSKVKSSK